MDERCDAHQEAMKIDSDVRDKYYELKTVLKEEGETMTYWQCAYSSRDLVKALNEGVPEGMDGGTHAKLIQLHPDTFRRHRPHRRQFLVLEQRAGGDLESHLIDYLLINGPLRGIVYL